ncbi:hypothetical protein H6F80_14155 [Leptolyngbya sp. FACHB-711]|nr:hypothetical protein [Leptolyngbya sp. FACHB-711]MBD2025523.1 hypothetical protein [Leptolyngbya sp. FACHB-711]
MLWQWVAMVSQWNPIILFWINTFLGLVDKPQPKVCFLPTAGGDSDRA